MPQYSKLAQHVAGATSGAAEAVFAHRLVPYLIDLWIDNYTQSAEPADIVETSVEGFSYLFDVAAGRLIAAWGISHGKNTEARPAARMRGHPLGAGPLYHRGHAIPHSLGGPTDINLVPQLGSVNVGPFRELEIRAVDNPGAFYFTHWLYPPGASQKPILVEQGLILPGTPPTIEIRTHPN